MRIKLTSVPVDDQTKALAFYTDMLGFEKKQDIDLGEFRWLTVVAPPEDFELLLEPNANPPSKVFQKALYDQGLPCAMLFCEDVAADYKRLCELGVVFRGEPVDVGTAIIALLEDTCGNLVQICQVVETDDTP